MLGIFLGLNFFSLAQELPHCDLGIGNYFIFIPYNDIISFFYHTTFVSLVI